MKLVQLDIGPFRGCPQRRLSLTASGEPALLVALTGPAASGKTTVLSTLAAHKEHVAPYGRTVTAIDVLDDDTPELEVRSQWQLDDAEAAETGSEARVLEARSRFGPSHSDRHADPALVHVLSRYAHRADWGKVDWVPVERMASRRSASRIDPLLLQQRLRLLATGDKYADLGRMFMAVGAPRREEVTTLLQDIRPGLAVDLDADGRMTFDTPRGTRRLSALATSERLSFEIAATFVLVGLQRSAVLIDTPELGVPAGEATRMVLALRRFAPTTQLIVATTDPGVLALPEARVIGLEAA